MKKRTEKKGAVTVGKGKKETAETEQRRSSVKSRRSRRAKIGRSLLGLAALMVLVGRIKKSLVKKAR